MKTLYPHPSPIVHRLKWTVQDVYKYTPKICQNVLLKHTLLHILKLNKAILY